MPLIKPSCACDPRKSGQTVDLAELRQAIEAKQLISNIAAFDHFDIPADWTRTYPTTAKGVPSAASFTAETAAALVAPFLEPALNKSSNTAGSGSERTKRAIDTVLTSPRVRPVGQMIEQRLREDSSSGYAFGRLKGYGKGWLPTQPTTFVPESGYNRCRGRRNAHSTGRHRGTAMGSGHHCPG